MGVEELDMVFPLRYRWGAGSSLYVKLTPEQRAKIKSNEEPTLETLGFIDTCQIIDYFCDKCRIRYEGSPKIDIKIFTGRFPKGKGIEFSVAYICNKCDNLVNGANFSEPNGIPLEKISYDETGDYKKPTPESIEGLLAQVEKMAETGDGRRISEPNYIDKLKTAQRWAGKIGYEIPENRIKRFEQLFRDSYIKNYERDLEATIEGYEDHEFEFSLCPDKNGETMWEGSSTAEEFPVFLEVLPFLTFPDNVKLKHNIFKVLQRYRNMFHDEITRLNEERRGIEEKIKDAEMGILEAQKIIDDCLVKAKLIDDKQTLLHTK